MDTSYIYTDALFVMKSGDLFWGGKGPSGRRMGKIPDDRVHMSKVQSYTSRKMS